MYKKTQNKFIAYEKLENKSVDKEINYIYVYL